MAKRGRGRGKSSGQEDPALEKALTNFPPVTDGDDEIVGCSACPLLRMTFREFRIHNMQVHYNIATTADDTTVRDHKFYSKKLNEMGKLTRITTFSCPRPNCSSRYKSALGLGYHLEICGKTQEEIEACMLLCDICFQKFTLPNLNWHKKTQHASPVIIEDKSDEPSSSTSAASTSKSRTPRKRQSAKAKKARDVNEVMSDDDFDNSNSSSKAKERSKSKGKGKGKDSNVSSVVALQEPENDPEFPVDVKREDWFYEPPMDIFWDENEDPTGSVTTTKQTMRTALSSRTDIAVQALVYLENTADDHNVWDTPERNLIDPFTRDVVPSENPVDDVQQDGTARLYLPGMEQSVEFKTKCTIKSESGVETGTLFSNYHRLAWFESEIVQSVDSNFIVYTGGPVTSMAWHPSGDYLAVATMKHYMETPDLVNVGRRRTSVQIYTHISCTDPTFFESSAVAFDLSLIVGFDYGYVNHLQWGNFWPNSCSPFFRENDRLMSDEENRIGYLCCAFEDSTCRILSLNRNYFKLEPNFVHRDGSKVRVYRKVPEVVLCIPDSTKQSTGQCTRFDWHEGNRYLVTGYASGLLAIFDLETKSKLLKTTGKDGDTPVMIFYPFWVFRGHRWPVMGIHFDPSAPRYFYTASMDRYLKTWDIDLRLEIEAKKIGMVIDTCWIRGWIHVAASTDLAVSNLSSQYNFVRFYQVGSSQGRPNCIEYYNLTSLDFYEGMTVQATENGKVTVTYFDAFWRDCDFERNKRKKNVVNVSTIDLDEETLTPLTGDWEKDRSASAKSDKEPKVILSFVKERMQGQSQMQPEPTPQQGENLIKYYHLVRVNKVAWCPTGKYLAVGYRNGLVTIIPATFDVLYNSTHL